MWECCRVKVEIDSAPSSKMSMLHNTKLIVSSPFRRDPPLIGREVVEYRYVAARVVARVDDTRFRYNLVHSTGDGTLDGIKHELLSDPERTVSGPQPGLTWTQQGYRDMEREDMIGAGKGRMVEKGHETSFTMACRKSAANGPGVWEVGTESQLNLTGRPMLQPSMGVACPRSQARDGKT